MTLELSIGHFLKSESITEILGLPSLNFFTFSRQASFRVPKQTPVINPAAVKEALFHMAEQNVEPFQDQPLNIAAYRSF